MEKYIDPELLINDQLSIRQGAILVLGDIIHKRHSQVLQSLAQHYKFSLDVPFKHLPDDIKKMIMFGTEGDSVDIVINDGLVKRSASVKYDGVVSQIQDMYDQDHLFSDQVNKYLSKRPCQTCHGYRLQLTSLCIKIDKMHIGQVCEMTVKDLVVWMKNLPDRLSSHHYEIATRVLKEISGRLMFLHNVGLEYLTLSRSSHTLSGGESQRIRLASQVGLGLSGVLYVLDEPSIGLHQSDNTKLIQTLKICEI